MANEARIQVSLQINAGNLQYQNRPTSFTGDMENPKGPTPGAITVSTTGVGIDLSELEEPGLCVLRNIDDTNWVEYGIYDTEANLFFPIGEILPGESYVLRLSSNLQEEYVGTTTGTSAPTNRMFFKAHGGPCNIIVDAFER